MVDQAVATVLGTAVTDRGAQARPTVRRWLLSRDRDRRRERLLGTVLIGVAVVLAGWTVYLGSSDSPSAIHRPWVLASAIGMNPYTLIWVGIDVLETAGLALIGVLLGLGRPATYTVALLALPLFVLDAWFDILTSVSLHRLLVAIVMAAVTEVPTAVTCGWVAWKASRFAAPLRARAAGSAA